MIIGNGVLVGIAEVDAQPGGIRVGYFRLRDGQAGPQDGVILKLDAPELRVAGKAAVQPVAQFAVEQALIVGVAVGEALRVAGGAGVGAGAVKDQVIAGRQPLRQFPHLLRRFRFVQRKLPGGGVIQPRHEFVPVVVDDYVAIGRHLGAEPLRGRRRRMLFGVNLLKGQRIEQRPAEHAAQQRRRQQRRQKPQPRGDAGGHNPRQIVIPQQQPRRQQQQHRHQREDVAQEPNLETFLKQQKGRHPGQQNDIGPARPAQHQGQESGQRNGDPGEDAQRQPQTPKAALPHLVEQRRGIDVLRGERPVAGGARHPALAGDVAGESEEIQQGVGRGDNEHRQRRQARQGGVAQQPPHDGAVDAPKLPAGLIDGAVDEHRRQRRQQRHDGYLGGQRQAQHGPQQYRIAPPPPFQHPEHRPETGQGEQHGESFGAVEVAVLNVNDGEGGKGGGQQPLADAVQPAPQDEQQQHRTHIGQRRQRAPGVAQIQRAPVAEQLQHRTDEHQQINQDAAQRKPLGVQRAAVSV